jgi:hypothetical protein
MQNMMIMGPAITARNTNNTSQTLLETILEEDMETEEDILER